MIKTCTKCSRKYLATTGYFPPAKQCRDGLSSWCRICSREAIKRYYQSKEGKTTDQKYRQSAKGKATEQRYKNTINGYLRRMLTGIKYRCNNPKCRDYKNYGKRGIRCLFTSDEFVGHITNDLDIKSVKQIEGLQIDRIDNNGNYERGNIRFVTCLENQRNKR